MRRRKIGFRAGALVTGIVLFAVLVVPTALAQRSATKPSAKDLAAGKATFISTCSACHTLKQAGAVGQIGPNLNKVKPPLTLALYIKAITNGGSSVMTKAQIAKYTTQMTPYKGVLSATQIKQIAEYLDSVT
jgi:mono/diheme cytochrome c family protein